ncbi:MAG: glycosyl hydrolase family 65 protein [Waddliaceae bacterium]
MKNKADWIFSYHHFDQENEKLREALFTLGNGFFATRGAAVESDANDIHYPGTYIAGGYNRLPTEVSGRIVENEDLVNFPNWLPIRYRIGENDWFQLKRDEILEYSQELHLKEGLYSRKMRVRDAHGNESLIQETRFIHIKKQHLGAIKWKLTPLNWSGRIELLSALDGTVKNEGVARYRELNHQHLKPLETSAFEKDCIYLKVETVQSELRVALAARTKVEMEGGANDLSVQSIERPGYVAQSMALEAKEGKTITIEKIVSLYTSRDHAISECGEEARDAVLKAASFDQLLKSHCRVWSVLWKEFGIEMKIEDEGTELSPLLILRLHIFHLLQTTSLNTTDIDVGVPARGWHGEAYRGHIFWDELFIFPTLNFRLPKITASLLKYRQRRLPKARQLAKESGFNGAMYPWQSGSNGKEESQILHLNPKSGRWLPDNSHLQRHVNLAIAYNFLRYFDVTGDFEFLHSFGMEVILDITRFWASIATYNKDLDRYEILGVMGPDEYHDSYPDSSEPGLNNNAYTNVLASWLLNRTTELLRTLPEDHYKEIVEIFGIDDAELEKWKEISQKLRLTFHEDGVINQFEGFDKLKEFPMEEYREKYGESLRLDRILEAEGDSPNHYQVTKQADLLMLFYLFSSKELEKTFERMGYAFKPEMIKKNIYYYLSRTAHGSTLSQIVHCWILSRLDRPKSWDLFLLSLKSDVLDVQGGTTAEGIHLGAMAGTVDLIQRCYPGIEIRENVLWFNPSLPAQLKYLKFYIHYRGHSLQVEMDHEKLTLRTKHSMAKMIKIGMNNDVHEMVAGEVLSFPIPSSNV